MALTHLEPKFVLDPTGADATLVERNKTGPLRTVLCRAKGTGEEAVDSVASQLKAAGWQVLAATKPGEPTSTHVLAGRDVQVWMTTREPSREGGLVSVMFTPIDG